jgi:hypothetical protein
MPDERMIETGARHLSRGRCFWRLPPTVGAFSGSALQRHAAHRRALRACWNRGGYEESRFGGPNDEGRPEHPLYDKGMRELGYAMCEVLFSHWAQERAARNETTARRIWGSAFEKAYRTQTFALRHFAFLFHDTTFECLAKDIRVVVSAEPASTLLAEYAKTMAQE